MNTCGGVDGAWIVLGDRQSIPRGPEAGPRDDEFSAADLPGSVYQTAEVVIVPLPAVVDASENGIGEVDSDLGPVRIFPPACIAIRLGGGG